MQPFARETIVDRRQPMLRWTAVFAGAAIATAVWLLLQLFGAGVALSIVHRDTLYHGRMPGLGTTAWSVLALLIAMFVGGVVAGRLAGHHERRVAGMHALLTWAFAGVVGAITISLVIAFAGQDTRFDHAAGVGGSGANAAIAGTLEPINARLAIENKPPISVDQVVRSARRAWTVDGYDPMRFSRELSEHTALTRGEIDDVIRQLGTRAPALVNQAQELGEHQEQVVHAAHSTGCALLLASLGLLLGAAAAVGGALLVAHDLAKKHKFAVPAHHTAPYPIVHPDIEDEPMP
jgi:hypothetical protein